MAIAIPAGVQIFAWLATIWAGRPVWKTPFLFVVGFLVIFVIGGITGVMVAVGAVRPAGPRLATSSSATCTTC